MCWCILAVSYQRCDQYNIMCWYIVVRVLQMPVLIVVSNNRLFVHRGFNVPNVTALYSYAVGTWCRRCERHSSVFVCCWYHNVFVPYAYQMPAL